MLQQHLPGPKFYVANRQTIIIEEYVDVRPMKCCGIAEQINAIGELIIKIAQHVNIQRHQLEPHHTPQYVHVVSVDHTVRALPTSNSDLLRLLHVPHVVCHGDLSSANIHRSKSDVPKTVVLDWDPSRLRIAPFWFDAASMPLSTPLVNYRTNRRASPLLDAYWDGQFNPALRQLALSAGYRESFLTSQLRPLAAAWILVRATWDGNWSEDLTRDIVTAVFKRAP
jgi:hypothetical protein